jgi:hypothetical protein
MRIFVQTESGEDIMEWSHWSYGPAPPPCQGVSYFEVFQPTILGAFAKLRKAGMSFVMFLIFIFYLWAYVLYASV